MTIDPRRKRFRRRIQARSQALLLSPKRRKCGRDTAAAASSLSASHGVMQRSTKESWKEKTRDFHFRVDWTGTANGPIRRAFFVSRMCYFVVQNPAAY